MKIDAEEFIGKTLLVGITYENADGTVRERTQFFGRISSVSERELIVKLADGTTRSLPPDVSALERARPGIYRLHSTNETVENPDYTAVWISRA